MEKTLNVKITAKDDASSNFKQFETSVNTAKTELERLTKQEKEYINEVRKLKEELSTSTFTKPIIKMQIDSINQSLKELKAERAALNKTIEGQTAARIDTLGIRYIQDLITGTQYNDQYKNIIEQGYAKAYKQQIDAAKKSTDSLSKATNSFGTIAKRIFGFLSIGYITKQYIELSDTFLLMEGRLKIVARNADELAASEQALFAIAQDTRQGYAETADLYARIARVTAPLNKSQRDNLQVTEAINKALIISGGSAQSASGALIQLGQGFASGRLRGQELNSVMEQTPRVAQMIADGLGISIGQLRKFAEEGKLTAEAVFDAIIKESQKVNAEFQQMPKTVGQAVTQMKNSFLDLTGYAEKATGNAKGVSDAITWWAVAITDSKADIVEFGRDAYRILESIGLGFLQVLEGFYVFILGIPTAYLTVIDTITAAINNKINALLETTENAINKVKSLYTDEKTVIGRVDIATGVSDGIKEHYDERVKNLQDLLNAQGTVFNEIMTNTTPDEKKISPFDTKGNTKQPIDEATQKIIEKTAQKVEAYLYETKKQGISDRQELELLEEAKKYEELLKLDRLSNTQKEQLSKSYNERITRIQQEIEKEKLKAQEDALLKYYKITGDKNNERLIEQKRYLEEIEKLNLSAAQKEQMMAIDNANFEQEQLIERLTHWEKYYKAIGDSASANQMRMQREIMELKKQGYNDTEINDITKHGNEQTFYSGLGLDNSLSTQLQSRLDTVDRYLSAEEARWDEYYANAADKEAANALREQEMNEAKFNAMAATAGAGFGTMAQLAKMYYEASDGQSKGALRAWQMLAIAEATINTYLAATKAYSSAGNPYLGAAMAALAIAQGMAQVAQIKAQKFHTGGYVTGTSNEVPAILQRGEYVVSRKGVDALDNINSGNAGGGGTSVEVVLLDDRQSFESYVSSRKGSTLIKKVIRE